MSTLESVTAILSTLAALVAVLLIAWFILRWMSKKAPGQNGSRHIKVLDRVMVGQDKYLLLVRVAGKAMLIGMTAGSTEKLSDIDEAELETDAPAADGMGFSSILQAFMNKRAEASREKSEGEADK